VARHWLWRSVLAATGGLTVDGQLPDGGCVVVANHSSHADTAALLAALRSRHAPRVAAAADYWFAGGWRSAICRALAGAFPVRRGGGGSTDMADAVALLRAGRTVIVYPEGTRGHGSPARFHSGAFRLATAAGVPVIPVGIAGTGDLLPKHGRIHRTRVTVRIGAPVVADPDTARAEVTRLANLPRRKCRSPRVRAARLATSSVGLALTAAWSFGEAIVWPLVPELVLFVLVLAAPRAGVRLIPTAVLASMAGGLCMLALAEGGAAPAAPLVTERMRVGVAQQIAAEGAAAVRHQPLSGIPFKVYAAEAGRAGIEPPAFLGAAISHRGVRIASVGTACALLGVVLRRWPERYLQVVGTGSALFAVGLTLVVAAWA
jgi:1-acyl-sn-glycerol-3-phosphate acyltransferase